MKNKLYVLGVGPGDPELLTLKAVRILKSVPCICVPKGREEGSSLALSIIENAVDLNGKQIIEAVFPMKKTITEKTRKSGSAEEGKSVNEPTKDETLEERWNETARNILSMLDQGKDVAFITIGDPTIYSTFFYLHARILALAPGTSIEIVPGVSSITAASARAGLSLGLADEKIAILPATYTGELRDAVRDFDTVVLMKVYKVFNEVLKYLETAGLADKAVYISRAGMREEAVIRNLRDVKTEDLNYFSLIIIRKHRQ